jgi:hypothetical protein
MAIKLVCPECGDDGNLATIERLYGDALVNSVYLFADGSPDVDFFGETKMCWDSSITVGVRCRGCYWDYEGEDWHQQLDEITVGR